MLPDATIEPVPHRSKLRLRFSLLALLVFVTIACLALAWLVQPTIVVATALFQVDRVQSTLSDGESSRRFDELEFELFKNTQIAKLNSYYVLNAALRQPGIAALPVFTGIRDPVTWLQQRLKVEFPHQGEILAISLRGPESQAPDLQRIVDAVAKAYQEEVINAERTRRLGTRDLKTMLLKKLRNEIEVQMKRLNEMMAESGESKASVDVRLRQLELDVLTGLLSEGQLELQRMDIEANAPSRIRQVQPAVVGPD
jgi:hypothetical protein